MWNYNPFTNSAYWSAVMSFSSCFLSAIFNRKLEEDVPNAVELGPLRQAIRFESVGYAPTRGKSVLKDLNVEIKRGSKVAKPKPYVAAALARAHVSTARTLAQAQQRP